MCIVQGFPKVRFYFLVTELLAGQFMHQSVREVVGVVRISGFGSSGRKEAYQHMLTTFPTSGRGRSATSPRGPSAARRRNLLGLLSLGLRL